MIWKKINKQFSNLDYEDWIFYHKIEENLCQDVLAHILFTDYKKLKIHIGGGLFSFLGYSPTAVTIWK
jgi:hypothetical protein